MTKKIFPRIALLALAAALALAPVAFAAPGDEEAGAAGEANAHAVSGMLGAGGHIDINGVR